MSAVPIQVEATAEAAVRREPSEHVEHVWDLPLRIFHWSLVVAIAAAYVTSQCGGDWMRWHGRIGSLVLGLVVFRLLWGFIGPPHARFASFLPTPRRLVAFFKGQWRGVGHSPLGALSVIALLTLIAAQVATGLFSNDDVAFAGPLATWVARGTSERVTAWHEQTFDVLAGFIVLHVFAIAFYLMVRKSNLVTAMITGSKPHSAEAPAIRAVHPRAGRLIAAVAVAVSVPWLIFRDIPPRNAEPAAVPAAADW